MKTNPTWLTNCPEAAAPDLLESLTECHRLLAQYAEKYDRESQGAIVTAAAAIAKAKGE